MKRTGCAVIFALFAGLTPVLHAQFNAQPPSGTVTPAWDKGIQPINRDSYYNAIACGKQGGARPECVFYDADLCKNPEFTLALYTPYKAVAYEVWQAVHNKQPAPTPSYQAAERTRITLGVTIATGSKNPVTGVLIKRGGKSIEPLSRALEATGGKFTFDFTAFAPTADITIEIARRAGAQTCSIEQAVLTTFR